MGAKIMTLGFGKTLIWCWILSHFGNSTTFLRWSYASHLMSVFRMILLQYTYAGDCQQNYNVPAVSEDTINKYELGLSSCMRRIQSTRSPERAEEIVSNLQVDYFKFGQFDYCTHSTPNNILFSVIAFCFQLSKALIEDAREPKTFPFKWNRTIYKKPFLMRPEDMHKQLPGAVNLNGYCFLHCVYYLYNRVHYFWLHTHHNDCDRRRNG